MVPEPPPLRNDPLVLYGTPISSFAHKVRLGLALKRLDYALRAPPGGYGSAAYKAIVPTGRIPALVHGDFVLAESDAILHYLEEAFPDPPLLPPDPRSRARARYLARLHDLDLEPPIRALFPRPSPEAAAPFLARIEAAFALVEQALDPAGPCTIGPRPTLADCAFPATLACADAILPAYGARPAIGPKLARCRATWAVNRVMGPLIDEYNAALAPWAAARFG